MRTPTVGRAPLVRAIVGSYVLLVVCVTAFVYVAEETHILGTPGQGLSAIWLVLVTLPLSTVALLTLPESIDLLIALPLLGLVQALILWAILTRGLGLPKDAGVRGDRRAPENAPKNGLGIVALLAGILGPFAFVPPMPIVIGLAGVICGVIAHGRVRRGEATNGGMALTGITLSVVGIIFSVATMTGLVDIFGFSEDAEQIDRCLALPADEEEACFEEVTPRPDP